MTTLTISATSALASPSSVSLPAPSPTMAPVTEAISAGAERIQAHLVRSVAGVVWLAHHGLIRPVRAELTASAPDEFTATEPSTGIFGVGDLPAAAIEDLRVALREHLEVLEQADRLSDDLQAQLDFLRTHLDAR